jgi:glycolate oxidase
VAQDEADRRRLWEARRACSPALGEAHRRKVGEDVVVPRAAIPEMIRRAAAAGVAQGFEVATFGHAGDGNLHANVLVDEDPDDPAVRARLDAAVAGIFRAALDLGGTLSGEHGIGLAKRRYVPWEQAGSVIDLQRRVKRVFDPLDLLNPGKLLPG